MRCVITSPASTPSLRMSKPVLTLDIAVHLAHDDTTSLAVMFAVTVSVAANGDAIFGKADGAFDASVDEKRFPRPSLHP